MPGTPTPGHPEVGGTVLYPQGLLLSGYATASCFNACLRGWQEILDGFSRVASALSCAWDLRLGRPGDLDLLRWDTSPLSAADLQDLLDEALEVDLGDDMRVRRASATTGPSGRRNAAAAALNWASAKHQAATMGSMAASSAAWAILATRVS